jgi:hypothetical protein
MNAQLCSIPGCRIRGRHLPTCSSDDCRGCLPHVVVDGIVCDVCTGSAAGRLAEIIQLTPDARLVAAGLVRRGSAAGGGGKPGSRSPANDDALDALDEIQNALTTMARDIAETRGAQFVSTTFADAGVPDPLTEAAKWLSAQLNWLRHAFDEQGGPYAAAVFVEIRECASRMRGMLDGPRDKRYLGPCGAVSDDCDHGPDCPGSGPDCARANDEPCDGDVYVREGAQEGACRTCGTKWSTAEREDWLDGVRREWLYHASEIEDAYPKVKAGTIRVWLARGLLVAHGEHDGRPLLKLGEVLDLAAGDAARREEARATRARRAAARAADDERLSA